MTAWNDRKFEDVAFGEYDVTPGTERFADGWYDGTLRQVQNSGEKEGRKQVKLVIDLDDLSTVQRTLGIAWGTKDGKPAAWAGFLSAVLGKEIGDPELRNATPKLMRNKRGAFLMKWNGRGYMDVMSFAPVGHRVDNAGRFVPRDGFAPQTQAPAPAPDPAPAPAAQTHRAPQTTATRPVAPSQAAPGTAQGAGLRVVGGAGRGVDARVLEGLTPGQRRVMLVGDGAGMDETAVRDFVRDALGIELEEVVDGQVGRISSAMRATLRASA